MGLCQSAHTFHHPDLLAAFTFDTVFEKWYRYGHFGVLGFKLRNSPLRIELVDLLNEATKALGGWPYLDCCCLKQLVFHEYVACQLVEPFNKVCKKFNDAKLFDMGLQCRAIVSPYKRYRNGGQGDSWHLFVLVEKRSDEKLRDVGDPLGCLKQVTAGNDYLTQHPWSDPRPKAALAWSPPEDWMTRLSPPYNEATNHV
jgi:hypothetical protein